MIGIKIDLECFNNLFDENNNLNQNNNFIEISDNDLYTMVLISIKANVPDSVCKCNVQQLCIMCQIRTVEEFQVYQIPFEDFKIFWPFTSKNGLGFQSLMEELNSKGYSKIKRICKILIFCFNQNFYQFNFFLFQLKAPSPYKLMSFSYY